MHYSHKLPRPESMMTDIFIAYGLMFSIFVGVVAIGFLGSKLNADPLTQEYNPVTVSQLR
ncbi:MAG TPA: hypothetical protein V6C88_00725 [Chroococcidiopsis sp.]